MLIHMFCAPIFVLVVNKLPTIIFKVRGLIYFSITSKDGQKYLQRQLHDIDQDHIVGRDGRGQEGKHPPHTAGRRYFD